MGEPAVLIPPFQFACVEANVYRSAHPQPRNHAFLRRLHLHTIVSVTREMDPSIAAYAAREGIALRHIRARDTKVRSPCVCPTRAMRAQGDPSDACAGPCARHARARA